uniref:Triacylglycerol lipase n=1 Tax=Timema shepardi TaxID=629360 RepID=A0A7R9G5P4_TIMSH|nr:unnamed protein product [Timema shepardi]
MRLQYGPCFLLISIAISQAKLLSTQNLVNIFEMIAAVKVPEAFLTVPQIIQLHGYPVETHRILTEDGYILTLHRIPGSGLSPPRPGKKPVLLQHGILSCSVDWIIMPNGLGYLLADAGYDVWMGNSRGNTYSSSHVELSIEDPEFWKFSWHEMGIYDLPATIDYILEQTMQKKLYYIGHSMGNTMFYVLCSMRPEYNAKIRAQFSLAPVAFVEHIHSKYQMVAFFSLNMNGTYVTNKRLSDVTYRIQYTLSPRKRPVVHFNGLKPYSARDPPREEVGPSMIDQNKGEDTRLVTTDGISLESQTTGINLTSEHWQTVEIPQALHNNAVNVSTDEEVRRYPAWNREQKIPFQAGLS